MMQQKIELSGIWRYQPLAWTTLHADGLISEDAANLPPAGEMSLPMNWQLRGLDSFDGRVRFTRSFTAPTLGSGERAFLVFRGVDYFADVTLNGQRLGRHAGYFQCHPDAVVGRVRRRHDCPRYRSTQGRTHQRCARLRSHQSR